MSRPTRHTHHAKAGTGSRGATILGCVSPSFAHETWHIGHRRETAKHLLCVEYPRKRQKGSPGTYSLLPGLPRGLFIAKSGKVAKWQSGKVAKWQSGKVELAPKRRCLRLRGCRGQPEVLPIVGTIEVMGERAWRSPGTGVRDVRRACGGTAFFHEKREKQGDLTSLVPSGTGTAADGLNSSI